MSGDQPELVFGLVGPVGVNLERIQTQLTDCLRAVNYAPAFIRISDLMSQIATVEETSDCDVSPMAYYERKIRQGNSICKLCENNAALAALAISEIRRIRQRIHQNNRVSLSDPSHLLDRPLAGYAYIIRQLKRPEEVLFLRQVYGSRFIQVSVHADREHRRRILASKFTSQNPNLDAKQCENYAEELIERDLRELSEPYGQRLEDVFHLGDVFVSDHSEDVSARTIRRFIEAFFGKNSISPNRDEFAAYIAASAALRSLDTSRQIGAAIFTEKGEIISLGCNEVPAYGGGAYWADDPAPRRDYEIGHDPNLTQKKRVAFDFLTRLERLGYLPDGKSAREVFESVLSQETGKNSLLMDITEFGRVAHAEMNAILDAARLGRSTKDAILFCTTFPCHNCAKHIVAAGIKRVVFIEPYPKSQATELHYDSIAVGGGSNGKVKFEHFIGISPRRYRDIFGKGKRRNPDGTFNEWYLGKPYPQIEDKSPAYIHNEANAIYSALQKIAKELGITVTD